MTNARAVRRRIGIFGGTFDPVHIAHLVAAQSALHQLSLDRVLLVVAGDPWMKTGRVVAPADVRVEMVAAAIEDVPGLELSTLEVDRSGPSYTYDTVAQLRAPDRELYVIIGADVIDGLERWHRADELRELVTLAIVGRDGDGATGPPGWRSEAVAMPRLEISSTDLRDRLARGAPVDFLIPAGAIHVIEKRRPYTSA